MLAINRLRLPPKGGPVPHGLSRQARCINEVRGSAPKVFLLRHAWHSARPMPHLSQAEVGDTDVAIGSQKQVLRLQISASTPIRRRLERFIEDATDFRYFGNADWDATLYVYSLLAFIFICTVVWYCKIMFRSPRTVPKNSQKNVLRPVLPGFRPSIPFDEVA